MNAMQIEVDNLPVGIMGLKAVMEEMAITCTDSSDEEVREELFKRLAEKNYIPEKGIDNSSGVFFKGIEKISWQALCRRAGRIGGLPKLWVKSS